MVYSSGILDSNELESPVNPSPLPIQDKSKHTTIDSSKEHGDKTQASTPKVEIKSETSKIGAKSGKSSIPIQTQEVKDNEHHPIPISTSNSKEEPVGKLKQ